MLFHITAKREVYQFHGGFFVYLKEFCFLFLKLLSWAEQLQCGRDMLFKLLFHLSMNTTGPKAIRLWTKLNNSTEQCWTETRDPYYWTRYSLLYSFSDINISIAQCNSKFKSLQSSRKKIISTIKKKRKKPTICFLDSRRGNWIELLPFYTHTFLSTFSSSCSNTPFSSSPASGFQITLTTLLPSSCQTVAPAADTRSRQRMFLRTSPS